MTMPEGEDQPSFQFKLSEEELSFLNGRGFDPLAMKSPYSPPPKVSLYLVNEVARAPDRFQFANKDMQTVIGALRKDLIENGRLSEGSDACILSVNHAGDVAEAIYSELSKVYTPGVVALICQSGHKLHDALRLIVSLMIGPRNAEEIDHGLRAVVRNSQEMLYGELKEEVRAEREEEHYVDFRQKLSVAWYAAGVNVAEHVDMNWEIVVRITDRNSHVFPQIQSIQCTVDQKLSEQQRSELTLVKLPLHTQTRSQRDLLNVLAECPSRKRFFNRNPHMKLRIPGIAHETVSDSEHAEMMSGFEARQRASSAPESPSSRSRRFSLGFTNRVCQRLTSPILQAMHIATTLTNHGFITVNHRWNLITLIRMH